MKQKNISKSVLAALMTTSIVFSSSAQAVVAVTQPEPDTPLIKQNIKQTLTVRAIEKLNNGVKFDLGNSEAYIRIFDKDLVKVSLVEKGQSEYTSQGIAKKDWKTPDFKVQDSEKEYTITTSEITIKINKQKFGVKFLDKSGNVINEDYMKYGSGYENDKPFVFKKTDKGEAFYGFGEQAGLGLNKRGKEIGMWNTDAYSYTKDTKYLYTTIPFFIGLKNEKAYGIFMDNANRSYFNMASESDDYYYFYANDGQLNYYFMNGPEIEDVLDTYTELTGKMERPAQWTLGFHQSKWGYTPEELVNVANTYREKKIPLDTMHFDIDYMDGYRVFTWNKDQDYLGALKKLKEQGFNAIAINDPAVKVDENNETYKEGIKNDYFAKNPDGSVYNGEVWPGKSAFPDFSKPEVRNWWGKNHSTLFNAGIDGIWNDMNEPAVFDGPYHTMPLDILFGEGDNKKTHAQYHNLYGHDEAEATYNGFKLNKPNQRPFVLTRDMYAGTQRYAALWTGDNASNWEHLQMSIPMNTNIGLSGQPFVGNDIGGFAQRPTPELFARWIQVGALLPFARDHYDSDVKSDVKMGQEPWVFGKDVEDISRKYINLRYQLLPYLYNAFVEASKTGAPVQQPLIYQFQEDKNTYNIADQFMFGSSIMAAPIVQQGQTSRSVYLPKGVKWVDFWTGEEFKGGQTITRNADLGTMPLYVKKDSIIPSREVQQKTDEKPLTNLILDTYLDGKATYSFYEDDNNTLDYKGGEFNITNFTVARNGNNIEFMQEKKARNYKESKLTNYTLKLNGIKGNPSEVKNESKKYTNVNSIEELNKNSGSYFYDNKANVLYVNIPADQSGKVMINESK
ncbi:alpha-glucosidase [Clostridium polyendosporum]|uniref:Alpha-glucosidase n=1 Tax=Clostridium polyendosporum TaxID=69208 RepID=A0A919S4Y2_9CLOT|nr:glycoside hydrolase family 31 protein [Clostridium polyendosporum]GIM30668.1 alpha-glucosidase [Clostridium polyendosporum]